MPVHVYFPPSTVQKEWCRAVLAGFDEWVQASKGAFCYTVVTAASQADITVTISPDTVVPHQHGAAGNTCISFTDCILNGATVELAAGRTTPNQLQEVAAHEFGHALGLVGHSDDPDDLMAPVEIRIYDSYGFPVDTPAHAVTTRDLNTLRVCYGPRFVPPLSSKSASESAVRDLGKVRITVRPQ